MTDPVIPPDYFERLAKIESNGNPNAVNPGGTAVGIAQFTAPTAAEYSLADPKDPIASEAATRRLAFDRARNLQFSLGRQPTGAEIYLAHQQGAGGATKLINNPNALAVDLVGRNALDNGATPNMTAKDFVQKWATNYSLAGPTTARNAPTQVADNSTDPVLQEMQVLRGGEGSTDSAPAGGNGGGDPVLDEMNTLRKAPAAAPISALPAANAAPAAAGPDVYDKLNPNHPTLASIERGVGAPQDYIVGGLAKGASGLLGLPGFIEGQLQKGTNQLVNWGSEALGYGDIAKPQPTVFPQAGDIYSKFFANKDRPAMEPDTMAGRLGQAAIAGAAGGAATGAAAPLQMALGAGSGVAAQAAGEYTGGNPYAELAAGLAPYLLGRAGVGAVNAGRAAVRPFTAGGRGQIVGNILNKSALGGVPDSAPATVSDMRPTLAQETGDPGLANLERSVARGGGTEGSDVNPNATAARFAHRYDENNQAVKTAVSDLSGGGEPVAARTAITGNQATTHAAATAAADAAAQAAHGEFANSIGGQRPNGQTVEQASGITIRDQLSARRDALLEQRAQAAGRNYGQVQDSPATVNLDPVNNLIAQKLARLENTQTGAAVETAQRSLQMRSGAQKTQMDQLQESLRDIRGQQTMLSRAGNNPAAHHVGDIADALEAQINDADTSLQRANSAYRTASEPLNPYMKPDAGHAAGLLKQDPYRQGYLTDPEQVPTRYFNSGSTAASDMQEFQRLAGSNRQATGAMRTYVAKSAYDAARGADGNLSLTRFDKWATDHADAIAQSPEVQADVARYRTSLQRADQAHGDMVLAAPTKEVHAWIESDPQHAVRTVLGSGDQASAARRVRQAVGNDDEGVRGLQQAYVDEFNRRVETQGGYSPAKAAKFLKDTAPTRLAWFNRDQHSLWEKIQQSIEMNSETKGPALKGSDTYQNLTGGRYLDAIVGKWLQPAGKAVGAIAGYGAAKLLPGAGEAIGSIGGPIIGMTQGGKILERIYGASRTKIVELLHDALENPALGKALMTKAKGGDAFAPKILQDYLLGARGAAPTVALGPRRPDRPASAFGNPR